MARLTKKTVILAKVEATPGTDAVPTGASNAIQVMNQSLTPIDAKMVTLNTITPWFGGSSQLVATSAVKLSFDVFLAGAGAAATGPAWGQLMLGCAMAETTGLTTPARVEYDPITANTKTLTIYYYDDGVLHKLVGAQGNVKASMKSGEAPKLTYEFIGIDGGPAASANPSAVLTNWKAPVPVTKANVTDIVFGCTYSAGALTGGTSYNSTGLTLDWANATAFAPMLTNEQVVLTDRNMKGTVELDLTAAQEVTMLGNVKANTLTGMGFVLGTATGNKIMVFMPAVQMMNPKLVDFNGMRLIGFDLAPTPVNGNDEIKLISL